jgi:NAD(P)-dependent dehydrogenase (short-subunit alcohol dehydrogenase family)
VSYSGFDLSGKTAVVIGGTAGIGRVVSCGLAEAGANVVATSRRPGHVERAALEIEHVQPRVINVDKNPAYPAAIKELKDEGMLRRRCRVRQ